MWVTYRYAVQVCNLTHSEIVQLDTILVHAPNGICWQAYWILTEELE